MKILLLSDLHRYKKKMGEQDPWLKSVYAMEKPDIVLIAGDVHEHTFTFTPYKKSEDPYWDLHNLFPNCPVVFVFGNHEFFENKIETVYKKYEKMYRPKDFNVHCLDIINKFEFQGWTILGNFLGYDGSMKTNEYQIMEDWADGTWADKWIQDYDKVWLKHCQDNMEKIKKVDEEVKEKKILLTHTVPDIKLNGWVEFDRNTEKNLYNAYSGVDNFLHKIKVDWSFSGHTHKRVAGLEINGCKCLNSGNDYHQPWVYDEIEL